MGSPFTLTLFRSAAEAHASELRAGELVRMRSACADALVQTDLEHATAVAALVDAADHDGAGAGAAAADAAVVTVEAGVPLVDELRAVVGPQPSDEALSSLLSEHGGDVRAAASAWFGAGVATTADEAAARVAPSSAARAYLQPPTGPISSRALWLPKTPRAAVLAAASSPTDRSSASFTRRPGLPSACGRARRRGVGAAAACGARSRRRGGRRRRQRRRRRRRRVGRVRRRVRGECRRRLRRDWRGGDGVAAAAAEALGALVPDFSLENVFEPKGVGRPEPRPWFADAPADAPPAPTPTRAPPDTPPRRLRQIRRHPPRGGRVARWRRCVNSARRRADGGGAGGVAAKAGGERRAAHVAASLHRPHARTDRVAPHRRSSAPTRRLAALRRRRAVARARRPAAASPPRSDRRRRSAGARD